MGQRFTSQKYGQCFFVTTTLKDWTKLGNQEGFYEALAASLNFCREKHNANIAGYVLMPDHVHLVIFIDGEYLGPFMRDFKKYTAQKVAPDLGVESGGIWMKRYDRVVLYSDEILRIKLNYVHQNPVKASLVGSGEDWLWSSASDYAGRPGPILVWTDWA